MSQQSFTSSSPSRIADIMVGTRHRRDLGDIEGLAGSIADIGLLHPIVIRRDGMLIAGERRLEACKKLGWTDIPVTYVDLDDIVRGELHENSIRKDFLPSEIDAIRRALEPIEKAAAKERQSRKVSGTGEQTRDRIGAFAGVSGRTVEKIAAVVAAAEREPERYGHLVEEMDKTGKVDRAHKQLKVERQPPTVKPPATPEQMVADDELPLPAPPASSGSDVEQPAELDGKLADVPDQEFEEALTDPTTKPTRNSIINAEPKQANVSAEALSLWDRLCDFERKNVGKPALLDRDPNDIMATLTPEMLDDVHRLAPQVAKWLKQIGAIPSCENENVKPSIV